MGRFSRELIHQGAHGGLDGFSVLFAVLPMFYQHIPKCFVWMPHFESQTKWIRRHSSWICFGYSEDAFGSGENLCSASQQGSLEKSENGLSAKSLAKNALRVHAHLELLMSDFIWEPLLKSTPQATAIETTPQATKNPECSFRVYRCWNTLILQEATRIDNRNTTSHLPAQPPNRGQDECTINCTSGANMVHPQPSRPFKRLGWDLLPLCV